MGLCETLGLRPPRQPVTEGAPDATQAAPERARTEASVNRVVRAGGDGAEPAPQGTPAPEDKQLVAYRKARADVQKLVDALKAHAQAGKVSTEIQNAEARLALADTDAAAKKYGDAAKKLAEARTICTTAKPSADQWVAYLREYASMQGLAMSFDAINEAGGGEAADAQPHLDDAQAAVTKTPPRFADAMKALKLVAKAYTPWARELIADQKKKLAAMEKMDKAVRDFAKADIDQARAYIATAESALAAQDWSVCRQNALAALDVVGPGVRMGERRGLYEKQRAVTVAAIAKLRAVAAVKAHADALDARVQEADALAAYDMRKFEQGTQVLVQAAQKAATWNTLAKSIEAYQKERASADSELAALDKHAAAARVSAEREAARMLLATAAGAATAADTAADPAAGWADALTTLRRARTDLAAAKKLADGLGAAGAAEAAAAKPDDPAGMKKALDALRADGKAAHGAPHAKAADAQLKTFDTEAAAAAKALADKDNAAAATALAAAAKALAEAKTFQSGHGQFAAGVGEVDAALKALKASKRAAKIQPRIDAVELPLKEAKAKDEAHDALSALAALRIAHDAIAAAKAADRDREAFDTRAAALARRVDKVVDATEQNALQTMATAAALKADALAFPDAGKALDAIEVRLDKGQLEALMKTRPGDPQIAKMAAKMVDKGGAATVDAMIQAIPDGGDMRQLNALAQGRYGVKFTSGKPLPADPSIGRPAGDPAKAMKAVCKMFEQIPQDIVKNKSITKVHYEDAFGSAGGGYSPDDGGIGMDGRAGVISQKFGAAQKNKSPITGAVVSQLPPDDQIDEDCKPKDATPVEYLSFAAAHEVGHGIDDATGFMARNGGQVKYGGWVTYGGSVEPVAAAIGGDARFAAFYKTPEQKAYVLGKLQNKPAAAPAVTTGSDEEKALQEFDTWFQLATAENVYRRQGDCDKIKIGDRIYHEAYARVWVSYLADARKKALTGYQFRAPGEWFAELYAGYRSGKLKDTHPAMEWLKKL